MDQIMINGVVGVLSMSFIGVIGWAFNLNTRIAVMERAHADLKEFLDLRLTRIENALGCKALSK